MAGKGEKAFTGTVSPAEIWLRDTLKADLSTPEAVNKRLKAGTDTPSDITISHMTELDTRNNLIGREDINPATGAKKRETGSEEEKRFNNAEEGKILVKTLREYKTLSDSDPAERDLKEKLQDRVISVIRSRPNGDSVITGKNPKAQQLEADQFIKDNYKQLTGFSDKDIQRILEDPTQNPITTSEAMLQAQLQLDEAKFAQKAADEALTDTTTRCTNLRTELKEFDDTTPGVKGKRLKTLEDDKTKRLASNANTESAIQALLDERSIALRSISDLHARFGRYGVAGNPDMVSEMERLGGRIREINDLAKPDSLPKLYEKFTKKQIEQAEYESLLKRKSDLPAEIAKADQDILRLTKEKTNAEAKFKNANEATYYANQSRVTTELKYSDSLNHIVDNAINKILNDRIDEFTPLLARGLTVEVELRVAEMQKRLDEQYKEKEWYYDWKAWSYKQRSAWKKDLIEKNLKDMVTWSDLEFNDFISPPPGKGTPLVDNYTALSDSEKAQMRAFVATRIVDRHYIVNHKNPEETQLFDLAQKGWIDQLHVLNIKNNPAYVEQLKLKFPGEEIKEDNPVLTAKVRSSLVLDTSLLLLMFGLSAASKENK